MKQLTLKQIRKKSVESFGLNSEIYELESPEYIAAALRRVASSLSPSSASNLTRTVYKSVKPILEISEEDLVEKIQQSLESLIGNGDLIEQTEITTSNEISQRGKILYLRPPGFIKRLNNSVFLIGIASDNLSFLPMELERRVEYYQHIRKLTARQNEDLSGKLKKLGLIEISLDSWDRRNSVPETESPHNYIEKVKDFLSDNPGGLEGLQVLNPYKNVRYYRGRWESVRQQTGFFIAKRPQAYGNDLWCYVELLDGTPLKMLDFPVLNKDSFGRDEAWRTQMAIDAERGKPQEFSINELNELYKQIKFYSPIPSWTQRRLDNLGEPYENDGCLFSYKVKGSEIFQEKSFLKEKLWLEERN